MTVTELREISQGRFLLGFSDGSEMKVSLNTVADFSLYKDKEISDEDFSLLFSAAALAACKERALRLISLRPMSCKELFDKLRDKGEADENAAACVQWLLDLHYLDDRQYAGMLVRHCAAKGWGRQRIKNQLYRKGLDKELWDAALAELPDMDDTVYSLLCRKLRSDAPDRVEMKRATDSLYRRGFSWDEIKAAVNRFWEDHPAD